MREKTNKHFDKFPAATLYLDDLKEIAAAVSLVSESFMITCGNMELDSVDEIDELANRQSKSQFNSIYIKSYSPYISIDLPHSGASAYVSEDSPELRGIIHKIEEIISQGTRKYFDPLHAAPAVILFFGAFINLFRSEYVTASIYLGLVFFSIFAAAIIQMKHRLIIHTYERNKKSSFFIRKKDEIILVIISGLFGAVAVLALNKYFA